LRIVTKADRGKGKDINGTGNGRGRRQTNSIGSQAEIRAGSKQTQSSTQARFRAGSRESQRINNPTVTRKQSTRKRLVMITGANQDFAVSVCVWLK